MKKSKKLAAIFMAFAAAATLSGCITSNDGDTDIKDESGIVGDITGEVPDDGAVPPSDVEEAPPVEEPTVPEEPPVYEEPPVVPQEKTVTYIMVTGSGVNIRSGASASHSSYGQAQKSTLYACNGKEGDWYKTEYKNKTAYISAKYCREVEMPAGDERVEAVIAEGTKLLGSPYIYGATRYHYGNGNLVGGFNVNEYDCSSLMQYIFKKGANVNLQMNTRTQIAQGTTVKRAAIKRGDLIFFTNASRQDKTGLERVGHVALYLGDNWILHTASDFAKIEQISDTRWGYYIQTQRMI